MAAYPGPATSTGRRIVPVFLPDQYLRTQAKEIFVSVSPEQFVHADKAFCFLFSPDPTVSR